MRLRTRHRAAQRGPAAQRLVVNGALRRIRDVVGALLGLVVASPALALAALGIKLEDRGPVLFRQRRVGQHGQEFELLKLRTMVVDAERQGAGYAVNRGDPRITRVGRMVRRLSIDELPQLWNVVRGEMSLVGPRPTLRYQVEQYTERQRRRLDVKPGITGWAQVHGRASLPWDERIELDVWYVENRSPWLDAKILARTPRALLGGTYKGETGGWGTKSALNSPRPDSSGSSPLPTRNPE
jgi:lipopolysaccharide/colanic/teichoic acid biosynthesis glycosyltransferase